MSPVLHQNDDDGGVSFGHEEEVKTFTGASFLVHALVSSGVTHVFGGHGGAVVPLIDAIEAHPDITWVVCRCEVNASQMAAAYAKLHQGRKIGCCIATSGPGAGHLLSGLVDADQDRVPVICITGMKDSGHLRYADFQDIDQGSIFRMAGLALSETVGDINQLLPLTRNAFSIATNSSRCAHLAVPINVQQEKVVARTHFCVQKNPATTIPATRLQIDTLIMALRGEIESKRHVLIACGYRAHKVGEEIERIAELMHAPVLTSYDGKGTVNERHPLSFGVVGVYGNAGTPSSVNVLDDCDTVIAICCSDLTELIASKSGLQIRRLIQIDDHMAAADTLRFSASTVFGCGHLKHSLKHVVTGLERSINLQVERSHRAHAAQEMTPPAPSPGTPTMPGPPTHIRRQSSTFRTKKLTSSDTNRYQNRLSGIALLNLNQIKTHSPTSAADIWDEVTKESYAKPTGTPSTYLELEMNDIEDLQSTMFCHPAKFFDVMKDKLVSDAVVCADIGDNALWMASSLAAKRGQSFLTSEHMGIMGMALNAGLAASLSNSPQTLVVAGDGGFQMSLNELATLKDHQSKNVLVVVIVNKRLGRVQNETWGATLKADGCSIGSPDYVKLFDAYGYPNGIRLSTSDGDAIGDAIDKGWQSASEHGCCVIELHQDPLMHPVMHKLSAKSEKEGRKSLQDFKTKVRNPQGDSIFPSIDAQLGEQLQFDILNWLDELTGVEKSEATWLENFDFITDQPSRILERQLASLSFFKNQGTVPKLFVSEEDYKSYDAQFKSSVLSCFSQETVQEIIAQGGISNSHPLCLQLLACPKDFKFLPHAHPNVELMFPIVGECWEKRYPGVPIPALNLRRKDPAYSHPTPEELEKLTAQLKQPGICHFLDHKESFDRVIHQSQILYNPAGSVHQSYTKNDGCLLVVLWSGLHANFDKKDDLLD